DRYWYCSTRREQAVIHQIEPGALFFHQRQIVEHARETIVATTTSVKNILGRYPDRQATRIDDFQPIGMQIKKDVPALRVGSVHQRIHQQLTNNLFIVSR